MVFGLLEHAGSAYVVSWGSGQVAEAVSRLVRGFGWGLRSSWRRPAYAIVSTLLIGASTAALFVVVAVLDALILRPPTARAPEELVFARRASKNVVSRPLYLDLQAKNATFAALFAFDDASQVELRRGPLSLESACQAVSSNFFSTLGVTALEGHTFSDADELPGAEPAVVISRAVQARLSLRVGEQLELNSRSFRVIGVLPASYQSVERRFNPDVWIPLSQVTAYRPDWVPDNRGYNWLNLGGRLKPQVTPALAVADLETLEHEIRLRLDPSDVDQPEYSVSAFSPARLALDSRARLTLLLGGAVAALFALTFSNFFALSSLRLLARRREIALRMALGGTRGDIASWLSGELALVLLLGVSLGRLASAALFSALKSVPPVAQFVDAARVALDGRSLGVGVVCVLLAGVWVWLTLVRQLEERELLVVIKETAAAPRRQRRFVALLAVQTALALCLVALSLGFLKTLGNVATRPLAFRTEHVLYADADARKFGWFNDRARSNTFYRTLIERLRRVPGVLDAAAASDLPLGPQHWAMGIAADAATGSPAGKWQGSFSHVSTGYWNTFGLQLRSGRAISDRESEGSSNVAVINHTMALLFWSGDAQAIGRTFQPWGGSPLRPVIGVVDDVPLGADERAQPHFYIPYETNTNPTMILALHVQPNFDMQRLNEAWHEVWPDPNPPAWHPIREHISASLGNLTAAALLASWVALFGIAVIGCGLYFFSAFSAVQTLRESALRMALGARPLDLVRRQVRRYGRGILAGMLLGGVIAVGARPVLQAFQVDLQPPDLASVIVAAALLGGIALTGICVPLLRLRQIDIIRTLDPK